MSTTNPTDSLDSIISFAGNPDAIAVQDPLTVIPTREAPKVTPEEQAKIAEDKAKAEELNEPLGVGEALWGSLKYSPLGIGMQSERTSLLHYTPTSEEWDKLFEEAQGNTQVIENALNGAANFEDVEKNINLHLNARGYYRRVANNGFLTQMGAGLVGSFGNPVDLATLMIPYGAVGKTLGIASTAGRVALRTAGAVGGGVASGAYASQFTGIEQDMVTDVASLLTLSAGIEGAGFLIGKLKGHTIASAGLQEKLIRGEQPTKGQLKRLADVTRKDTTLGSTIADGMTRLSSFFSNFSSKNWLRSHTNSKEGLDFFGKIDGKFEEGAVDKKGTVRRYNKGESVFDTVEELRGKDQIIENQINDLERQIPSTFDPEELNQYIHLKLRGRDNDARLRFNPEFDKCKPLQEMIELEKKLYKEKGETGVAMGIFDDQHLSGYAPTNPNKNKMADFMATHGGETKGIQYLVNHLVDGVLNDYATNNVMMTKYIEERISQFNTGKLKGRKTAIPENKKVFNKGYKKWLEEKAHKTVFGWLDQRNKHTLSDGSKGFSFQKHVTPWNLGYFDKNGFNMCSLLENHSDTRIKYNNRFNGAFAVKKVMDTDYDGLMKQFDAISEDHYVRGGRKEADKTKYDNIGRGLINRIYGLGAMSDTRELGYADALCDALRNIAFGSYNTFMGLLNYTDTANAIRNYGWGFLAKSLPYMHNLMGRWCRGGFNADDFAYLKAQHLGEEVANVVGAREITRRTMRRYQGINPLMAKVVAGTKIFAEHVSPGSYLLRESQRTIVETAQASTFGSIALEACGHKLGKGNFIRDVDWDRMNINKTDRKAFMREMKKYFKIDENGHPVINRDHDLSTKSRYIMRRISDYVADNSIQRHTYRDMFTFDNSTNPFIRLAMQFKSFSLDSYNKRFLQLKSQAMDEGAWAATQSVIIAGGLSAVVNLGTVFMKSWGMDEEKKRDYFKHIFGTDDLSKMSAENVFDVALNVSLLRNPYFAAPSLLLNTVGIGDLYKSTASTQGKEAPFGTTINLPKEIGNMFPALRVAQDSLSTAFGAGWLGYDAITGNLNEANKKKAGNAFSKVLNLVPQVPFFSATGKQVLNDELKEHGYK